MSCNAAIACPWYTTLAHTSTRVRLDVSSCTGASQSGQDLGDFLIQPSQKLWPHGDTMVAFFICSNPSEARRTRRRARQVASGYERIHWLMHRDMFAYAN